MGILSRDITRVVGSAEAVAATDTINVAVASNAGTMLHARFTASASEYLQYGISIADALGNVLYSRSNIRNAVLDLFESFELPVGTNVITITNQAASGTVTVAVVLEYTKYNH